ncbi:hypothetical protein [Streptomyces sp. NPDC015131]|uniref:hypothetical protein n=1 Tax=Streptomyces sp. NPDC015131 TaxID=3364941 RepID=UPI0036F881D8
MTSPGPVDTPIRVAQCVRCQAYVFLCHSSGVRTTADPAPVTRDGYVAALMSGRRVFDLQTQAGRPHKLFVRTRRSTPPAFGPDGRQTGVHRPLGGALHQQRPVLAEHGCGANAMDAAKVEELPDPPRTAPATPGARRGGSHQHGAPGSTAATPSRAGSANHRRSDERLPTCDICKRFIKNGETYAGIHHGSWIWAVHEECPE